MQYKHFSDDIEWLPRRGNEKPEDGESTAILVNYFQSIGGKYQELASDAKVISLGI